MASDWTEEGSRVFSTPTALSRYIQYRVSFQDVHGWKKLYLKKYKDVLFNWIMDLFADRQPF